ncbi:unnamed protein product [Lupinus luteus]|uniref:Uncharacterized protein n=1 Tax=Lupinus luteus TaxID=3873 RepID=A0AAV1W1Q4_LUPLU
MIHFFCHWRTVLRVPIKQNLSFVLENSQEKREAFFLHPSAFSHLLLSFVIMSLHAIITIKGGNSMCSFSSKQKPYGSLVFALPLTSTSKRHHKNLRLSMLNRRRALLRDARRRKRMIVVKTEIEMKNLKLYMENQNIIEENKKLRKQAMLLHKENKVLLSELQMKLSEQNNNTSHFI